MKRLAIIDGNSVFYRGYYAMPSLSLPDGTPTGGVYGFASMSLELIKKLQPDYVCVAWDKPKTNIRKRQAIYADYKAGRKPAPPDFYAQIPLLHELLEALSWPLYQLDDYEADDIMASLSRQADEAGLEVCLISSDLDMLQCLTPNVHMYALKKGFSQIELYKPEYFEEKYGIKVDQFLDLKSLKGDSSDNIPGVPGVGEKGAIKLLQEFGSLDGIYENIDSISGALQKKLIEGKASSYMSRQVSSIMFDAPLKLDLPAMDINDLDTAKLKQALTKLQFNSLLRTLPGKMRHVADDKEESTTAQEPASAKLVDWDSAMSVDVLMNQTLVQQIDGNLFVSTRQENYAKIEPSDLSKIFAKMQIVTHDGDTLCRMMLEQGIEILDTLFDIRQAGFLIDPLKKSRTVQDVTNYEGDDPAVIMSLLWQAYDSQKQELDALPRVKQIAYDVDFRLIPILARMEHRGIILDTDFLASMNQVLLKDINDVQKKMFEMVGDEFNISSPAQLAEVLYTKLQLPTFGIKKGKTGYSTGQKELDKLRGQHPIIEQIEKYRELTKLQNTYVDALPKLVDKQSRLHTTFHQDVAATGRLSSADPNLQNIPIRTELGRKIREAFRPAKGNLFVSADYSQFELRLAAVLANDENMINDFNNDIDIHAKTAADVHGIALSDVTKAQRRDAKVVNFGVLYGMGPHALAQNTGMTFGAAKQFIDDYFKVRSKIRQYIDETIKQAHELGYVETYYGRRRPSPDVKSSNFIVRSGAERAAANMPIQGTEADLMKMAMIKVEQKLNPSSASEPLGYQVLQIHDSILVECPKENSDKVSKILVETMESIAPELPVKLKVDVSIGQNWGEV
jgi:DNA polymerase-1